MEKKAILGVGIPQEVAQKHYVVPVNRAGSTQILATADPSGRITWANAPFHELHGVPAGSLRDVLLRDLVVAYARAARRRFPSLSPTGSTGS